MVAVLGLILKDDKKERNLSHPLIELLKEILLESNFPSLSMIEAS